MDSMVSEGDDGLPVYDRPYNASDLRGVVRHLVSDGICGGFGDELAVSSSGGAWHVGTGAAVASGLLIDVHSQAKVVDSFDITTGMYAYIIVAGRFDSTYRDGAIYARITDSAEITPERTDSVFELVIARVDWLGNVIDLRMNDDMCGMMAAVPVDNMLNELSAASVAATDAAMGAAASANAAAAAATQAAGKFDGGSCCAQIEELKHQQTVMGSMIADLRDEFYYLDEKVYAPSSKASFDGERVTLATTCQFNEEKQAITLA
jgi:hypothetical protein